MRRYFESFSYMYGQIKSCYINIYTVLKSCCDNLFFVIIELAVKVCENQFDLCNQCSIVQDYSIPRVRYRL